MAIDIKQSSQFKITDLSIITKLGKFDIGSIFDELNGAKLEVWPNLH